MFYEEIFGPLSGIVLIVFGVVTILSVLILIVCFSVPKCWGYELLRKRKNDENKTISMSQVEQQHGNIKLGDISYRSWRLGSLYNNESIYRNGEPLRESFGSNYTELDSKKTLSSLNLVDSSNQKQIKKVKEFPTELTLSLQFSPTIDEPRSIEGKLIIGIEALFNLPPKQYNCAIEPYVVIKIVKQSWIKKEKTVLHNFRTRGIRHTVNPVYRETFIIADASPYIMKDCFLSLSVFDHDRYANHTELSTLQIPFKNVNKIFTNPEKHIFNYRMKRSNQEFGNILLAISYLPTAERLSITVVKLRNLKYLPTTNLSTKLNLYVRVLMLHGKTGRKIRKKKTKILHAMTEGEFNDTLTFALSPYQLDTVQFLVILCNKVIGAEIHSNDCHSDSEDSVPSSNKVKDSFIGKVVLGKGVRGKTERLHWFSVLQNPRRLVTEWHILK
ncbi:synaptotagmin 20 [Cotesia typhae]|uniref:synaptotagmin 20 n=1 Tax=Cotesia typhae TaxID=2053667 RepID=UPI003D6964FD